MNASRARSALRSLPTLLVSVALDSATVCKPYRYDVTETDRQTDRQAGRQTETQRENSELRPLLLKD